MKALIALFAASLVTTAIADDNPKQDDRTTRTSEATFKQLDRDSDNRLSRTEAQDDDVLSARFSRADQNSDGFISKSEYRASLNTDQPVTGRER